MSSKRRVVSHGMDVAVADWPAEGTERPTACPLCGAPPVGSFLHVGLVDHAFGAPGQWDLRACPNCGGAYLDPRPTRAAIGEAYARYYTHGDGGDPPLSPWGKGLRRLRYGYVNGFGYELAPAWAAGRWLLPLVPGERDRALRTVRHLRKRRPRPSLLDVGCGNGAFLDLMRWQGWDVAGIEPDPDAVAAARARGIDATMGTDATLAEMDAASFDAVTMHHVLEHSHDPVGAVRAAHRLLRPGGDFWVATPNLASVGHARFGADWRGLEPPRHLSLLTPPSLRSLLDDAGFDVLGGSRGRGFARWYYAESTRLRTRRTSSRAGFIERRGRALEAWVVELLELGWRDRAEEISFLARRRDG